MVGNGPTTTTRFLHIKDKSHMRIGFRYNFQSTLALAKLRRKKHEFLVLQNFHWLHWKIWSWLWIFHKILLNVGNSTKCAVELQFFHWELFWNLWRTTSAHFQYFHIEQKIILETQPQWYAIDSIPSNLLINWSLWSLIEHSTAGYSQYYFAMYVWWLQSTKKHSSIK